MLPVTYRQLPHLVCSFKGCWLSSILEKSEFGSDFPKNGKPPRSYPGIYTRTMYSYKLYTICGIVVVFFSPILILRIPAVYLSRPVVPHDSRRRPFLFFFVFCAFSTPNLSRPQVSTTIGPSAGVLVMVVSLKVLEKKFDTRGVNNGILSGLVAITSGAPLVNPEGAFVIGVISAGVYYTSAKLLLRLRIDDVVDAVSGPVSCVV